MSTQKIRFALGGFMIAAALVGCGSSQADTSTASNNETTSTTGSMTTTATTTTTGAPLGTPETQVEPPTPTSEPAATATLKGPQVVVSLEGGKSFTLQLDQENTPQTVAGITALVKKGFYNGIRVHRVEEWVTQWGDPLSKNGADAPGVGSGGTGKNLPFEAGKLSFVKGTLGMASTGGKVGGDCQMFVVTRDSTFLDGDYSAFGKVVKGMDVVQAIQKGDKIVSMKIK